MRRLCIVIALLSFLLHDSAAQTTLQGRITQQGKGTAISDVVCTVTDMQGRMMLAFAISDAGGNYNTTFKYAGDSIMVSYKLMGYRSVVRRLPNRSSTLNITMHEEGINLKEVVVKSDIIMQRGDTITYSVNAIKRSQDTQLGDVIKRLPGVEVAATGEISYMGKKINKFYIEGMDLLGRRYNIATEGIPSDAVQSIQVLERHQPKKVLREVSTPDEAAMNIILKRDRRLRPVGTAALQAGASEDKLLWLAEITSLVVGGKGQEMYTLKTNDTGKTLSHEVEELGGGSGSPSLLSASMNAAPQTVGEYTHFNTSWVATANKLIKLSDDDQLKVNLHWLDEQDNASHENVTVFGTDQENPLVITRVHDLHRHARSANVQADFNRNASKAYIDNSLSVSASWDKARTLLSGSNDVTERFHTPSLSLRNALDMTWEKNGHFYTLKSTTSFVNAPQWAEFEGQDAPFRQDRNERNFSTNNTLSHTMKLGRGMLSLKYLATLDWDMQGSNLHDAPDYFPSQQYHYGWNHLSGQVGITPGYELKGDKHTLNFSLPLQALLLKHTEDEASKNHSYLLLNPAFSWFWRASNMLSVQASASHARNITSLRDYSHALYFSSNTMIRKGADEPLDRRLTQALANVIYRNPYHSLFVRSTVSYSHTRSNLIAGYDFIGTRQVYTSVKQDNSLESFAASLNVGKLMDFWHTNLNFTASTGVSSFMQYLQGNLHRSTSNTYSLMGGVAVIPAKFLSVDLFWQAINSHVRHGSSLWLHRGKAETTFLFGRVQLSLIADYSKNQLAPGQYKDFILLNSSLTYKHKKVSAGIKCTNMANSQSYVLRTQDGINMYDDIYILRPRQLVASFSYTF